MRGVAYSVGYHLATGELSLVYLQNSGLGNAVNPLASLADDSVYGIPMVLMIGWRGEPGTLDEPQHMKQGAVTLPILESLGIPFVVFDAAMGAGAIERLVTESRSRSGPVGLVVRRGFFNSGVRRSPSVPGLSRRDALEANLNAIPHDAIVVSTAGKISRELAELRIERTGVAEIDFLNVGAMGHVLMIAYRIAANQNARPVICPDGDGNALMHMGGMAYAARGLQADLHHIVLNNACHESVGGQPTAGDAVNFCRIAEGCGYRTQVSVGHHHELEAALESQFDGRGGGAHFLEVCVAVGSREDLPRPSLSPQALKSSEMARLSSSL